jgi:hypothetical protein
MGGRHAPALAQRADHRRVFGERNLAFHFLGRCDYVHASPLAIHGATIPKEVLMRILALAILATVTVSIGPAAAQTYDPAYPVCLHVYSRGANYYECRYTSLPQCNASASGRAAQCVINPYFGSAGGPAGYRQHRRVY